jgi:hypothetical protein
VLAEEWLTALDAPARQLTLAGTSGHCALREQPDVFHRFMIETVLGPRRTGLRAGRGAAATLVPDRLP